MNAMVSHVLARDATFRLEARVDAGSARRWLGIFRGALWIGAASLAAGAVLGGARFWGELLLVAVYLLGLGLAGAAMIAIDYLAGARWSAACRRLPEAMTSWMPWGALGVAVVLACCPALYPWTQAAGSADAGGFKDAWLDRPFFLARAVVYVAIWVGLARALVRNSRRQDQDGDARWRSRNTALSALFLVLFAVTIWLASVDWLMSLEPAWSSTMYGVHFFSGTMSSGLAAAILCGLWLRRLGVWRGVLNEEHLHDFGKLLLTFCTFWAYIWFSQYLLIWYANIPEETVYYIRRVRGAWGSLMIASLLLNWAIPFFALLPRKHKRDGRIMGQMAAVVLLGRWLDLYLLIAPARENASAAPSVWSLGLVLGAIGLAGTVLWRDLRQAAVIPVRDPCLAESLHYHQ